MITVKGLRFCYSDTEEEVSREVLRGIDLEIEESAFVAVLGHNGSGKSTLAKHFNAILTPTAGTVTVDGMDTADPELLYDIRGEVGMVFQNPDNQMVATIVEEDVAFAPENLGIAPKEIRERVEQSLEAVHMTAFKQHAPHMLSGGQKQRVAIAGILAMRPKVLVLDEATAMLDPVGRREVMETIRRLHREEKLTVVLITHYMDEAVQADRVVVMDDGKIVMDAPPEKVFTRVEEMKALGLDTPQATELAHRLGKAGAELSGEILTPGACVEAILDLKKKTGERI